jgi:hypothetical protein
MFVEDDSLPTAQPLTGRRPFLVTSAKGLPRKSGRHPVKLERIARAERKRGCSADDSSAVNAERKGKLMESELFHWLCGMPWFGWIALVAIVSGSIAGVMKTRYQHLERMEMIRHGVNPDAEGRKPIVPPEV